MSDPSLVARWLLGMTGSVAHRVHLTCITPFEEFMDELIAQVAQRTGLPPEQARAAVEAVIDHLRSRLPGPIAAHLDSIVKSGGGASAAPTGQPSAGGSLGGLAGELGGLFGKK